MKKVLLGCTFLFVCSCGYMESKQVIYESDLENLYIQVESLSDQLDDLIANGGADEDELLELKSEVEDLQEIMDGSFVDMSEAL